MTDKQGRCNALALASLQMEKARALSFRKGKIAQADIEHACSEVLKEMFQELVTEELAKVPTLTSETIQVGNVTVG